MKNSEIVSAVIGGAFVAVPALVLSVPIIPSIAIGACAFAAGELVFRKDAVTPLKEANFDLYKVLEKAKKDRNYIHEMINYIDDENVIKDIKEITETVSKIIKTIEKEPDKAKKLNNFFDYYLPVTVKLLKKYDEIENQNISSKEVEKFNENTSKTISEINDVFKKFLNNLYESDMMDTNVEIKVLNSMLKSDGLTKNELKVEEDKHE